MTRIARGYTLIEILVALTILSVVFAVGFAGFRDYSRRQELETLTRQLRGDLAKAREDALAGIKSTSASCNGANTLLGQGFSVGSNLGIYFYRFFYHCSSATVLNRTVNVPSGYSINWSPNVYFYFKSVGQGTSMTAGTSTTITITQTSTGAAGSVTVDSTGNIQ